MNHSVVIGVNHLAEHVIGTLCDRDQKHVIVSRDRDVLLDFVEGESLCVCGSPTDSTVLSKANVKAAKEVFVLLNDLKESIACVHRLRATNKTCLIYVQVFEHDDFSDVSPRASREGGSAGGRASTRRTCPLRSPYLSRGLVANSIFRRAP